MSEKAFLLKAARIKVFLVRLDLAPPCNSLDEAFDLVCTTLNSVEDEFTEIPYNQETSETDGRLYPPLRENLRGVKDHPNVKRHRHRFHVTYFGENGSIEIQDVRSDRIDFQKPGKDGRGVWQL